MKIEWLSAASPSGSADPSRRAAWTVVVGPATAG
jgi:hypothetical protein